MYNTFANPVICAATLTSDKLIANFEESRDIHRAVQAGDYSGDDWNESNLVYLMLFGDCMAREIIRRGLEVKTNLVLQHPAVPFPPYWLDIQVPEFRRLAVPQGYEVWGPDLYVDPPEPEVIDVAESAQSTDMSDDVDQEETADV